MRPSIHAGLLFFRRYYREELWHVIQKSGSDKVYRVNAIAWFILQQCDGKNSLEALLVTTKQHFPESTINETTLLKIINQYAREGLLLGVMSGASRQGQQQQSWHKHFSNPLFIRLPLIDPSALADQLAKVLLFLKKPSFAFIAYLLLFYTLVQVFLYWEPLTNNIVDKVFRPNNWLWLMLLYPITKLIHELGHAVAVHLNGGQVKEAGIVLMYGMPLPYVEASDAATFKAKRARVSVDMAGIVVELLLACIAFFVWLSVADGLIHQLAYNVLIICSISTIFFNANPLMRFDGYYALTDAADLPNLASRSSQYWRYLFKRYLFSDSGAEFIASKNESRWLLPYGFLAFCYRWFVMLMIVFLLSKQSLFLASVLAVYLVYLHVFKPLLVLYDYFKELLHIGASRQSLVFGLVVALLLVFVFFVVKVPVIATAYGVVVAAPETHVVSTVDGELIKLAVADGEQVVAGQLLLDIKNPLLEAERRLVVARLDELRAQYSMARIHDPIEAEQLEEDIIVVVQQLQQAQLELEKLKHYAGKSGIFYSLPGGAITLGSYVYKGDLLAYVLAPGDLQLKVLTRQDDLNAISHARQQVLGRFEALQSQEFKGQIDRIYHSASNRLPSAVFSARYGGPVALDPEDSSGMTALDEWFEIDVHVNDEVALNYVGETATIKFFIADQTLAWQFYRKFRRLFINELSI